MTTLKIRNMFFLALFFLLGLIAGYWLSNLQHDHLYQEVRVEAAQVKLQMLNLEKNLNEMVVLDYFLDSTYQDIEKLGRAINRMIYDGPRETLVGDS